jgi:hypothetical protein
VPEAFLARVKDMLAASGEDVARFAARPCREGGNNLVFEIDLGPKKRLAKKYYRSADDSRDRLGAEWPFIAYARGLNIDCVPAPCLVDHEAGIGIYEFVDGVKVAAAGLCASHVDAAVAFFRALNGGDRQTLAAALPVASEACFSIDGHLALIGRRVERLAAITADDELTREAARKVAAIKEAWQAIRAAIEAASGDHRVELADDQRCVSPSDFGFHNALQRADGRVVFIDFEYAGWDDPAKMAADFFCQPQVPVPMSFFEPFLDRTMAFSDAAEELKARARLLLPAQRVKWACIMLNDFLPDAAERRRFANPEVDAGERKRAQLDKVARALHALNS